MENGINWDVFEGKYWSPSEGHLHKVVLGNWDQVQKDFKGNKRIVLTFDVHEVDGQVFTSTKEFSVSGKNALLFKDIIAGAINRGEGYIMVSIARHNKEYEIADMYIVQQSINNMVQQPKRIIRR